MSFTREINLWFIILGSLLSGCGSFHDPSGQVSQVQISSFALSVAPVLRTNCFSCHSQSSSTAGSKFFMNSNDASQLFSETVKRIVSGDPSTSSLLLKGKGEQGHGGGNQLASAEDQKKIQDWILNPDSGSGSGSGGTGSGGGSSGGSGSGGSGGTNGLNLKFTGSQAVPQNLTLNGAYRFVRFPLSGLGHAAAFVELGIRYYTDGGYEFSQWRVYSPNYPLQVQGLYVLVSNGLNQALSNTLASVILNAPQSAAADSNSTPLPGAALSTRAAVGTAIGMGDELKLGFVSVTQSNGGGSQNSAEQTYFFNNVKPLLLNNCASCHGNTNGSGNFNMPNNDDTVLYQNVRARITPRDSANSRLYTKGTGTGHGGGNRLPNQSDRDVIINWINMVQ